MLKRVRIQNYRCLQDVKLTLLPLTVLVGPNGSGKSAVLDALDPKRPLQPSDVWQHGSDLDTTLKLDKWSGHFHSPERQFYTYQSLQLDPDALRSPTRKEHARKLERGGENLANLFATLTPGQKKELAAQFGELVPSISDVDVMPQDAGQQGLIFQDRSNPNVWLTPHEISDGVLLVFAYLALQHQTATPDLLACETPERGVHPRLLPHIVEVLRKLTRGETWTKPIQVILTTHSPALLEHVEPDEVRLLARDAETGVVRAEQPASDSPDWRRELISG